MAMHDEGLAAWIAASDILPGEVADIFLQCYGGDDESLPEEETRARERGRVGPAEESPENVIVIRS